MNVLQPLLLGSAFGWVLHKGKLGRYETIVNVFRFTDFTVVKFLVTALMVGALGIQALVALGITDDVPIPTTYVVGNLVGGLVFGAGMALAGFCPGTVAAGAGEGRLDNAVAGSAGLYTGAVLFGVAYPKLYPLVAGVASFGSVTFAGAFHVDAWLTVVLLWEAGLLLLYVLERAPRLRRS